MRAKLPVRFSRLLLERLEDRSLLAAGALASPAVDPAAVLVQFREGATPTALPGTTLGRAYDIVSGLYEVRLGGGVSVDQALAGYRANPAVLTATANQVLEAAWKPNDPLYRNEWGLNNTGQNGGRVGVDIRAEGAWGITTGTMRTAVAVIDSGIDYTHPDLYQNIWINQKEIPASRRALLLDTDLDGLITFRDLNDPRNKGAGKITDLNGNGFIDAGDILKPMVKNALGKDTGAGGWADGISQDGDEYVDDLVGWNFALWNNNPFDDYGHGSHIAGTVGATGNNGLGVTGVNWAVSLMPLKFFDSKGNGGQVEYIAALEYSLAKGARVSLNSFVDSQSSDIMFAAIKKAQQKGQVYVAAAGNGARNTDLPRATNYPSGYNLDNIIAVAAMDSLGNVAGFSNYGVKSVDLAAPGVNIYSTNPRGGYGYRTGTSMAAPQVAGVVALVIGLRPEWNYRQVINWVLATARKDLTSLTAKVGFGLVDANAAVHVPPRYLPQPSGTTVTGTAPTIPGSGGGLRPSEFVADDAVSFTTTAASSSPGTGARQLLAAAPLVPQSLPEGSYSALLATPAAGASQPLARLLAPTDAPRLDWAVLSPLSDDSLLRRVGEARQTWYRLPNPGKAPPPAARPQEEADSAHGEEASEGEDAVNA